MKNISRCFFFFFSLFGLIALAGLTKDQSPTIPFPNSASITANQLWNDTLPLIEDLSQNLSVSSINIKTEMVNGKNLTIKDVSFESLNFVGAVSGNLTMRGYLVLPDNGSGSLGAVPGIILMHGITGDTNQTLPWAKIFAARDYIALCYDHPGHGRSGGPAPNIANFFNTTFVDHYNETSHLYLSNCAALQAIRVLEVQAGVNASQLIIGGSSYGGMNAMIAGSIYHSKVRAVINCIAAGDLLTSMKSEGKLIRLVTGGYNAAFETAYALTKELLDPLYYINQPTFPPMLTLCGTTDDFFDLVAFNTTFNALQNSSRALSITPNGHHVHALDDPTQFYWLNATLFGGPQVPQVTLKSLSVVGGTLGTRAEVNFTLASATGTVARVEVIYAHVDLLGRYWYELPVAMSPTSDYSVIVPTPVLNSRTMCYIRVTTTTGATFTSPVYEVNLVNWFSPVIWGFFILAIAGSVVLLIRHRFKEIRRAEAVWEGQFPANIRNKVILDSSLLLLNGFSMYLAIALPWVDFGGTNAWTGTYLLNDYFTLFGNWIVPALVLVLLVGFILALRFPLLVGAFDLGLPVLVAFLWAPLTGTFAFSAFASPTPGPAVYAMVIGAALALAVGIFRARYWRPIKRVLKNLAMVRRFPPN